LTESRGPAWFAVRSLPKHEHIAAAHLRQDPEIEVFLPQIRFQRMTRRGTKARVTEALFPGYFFARFDFQTRARRVGYAPGVRGLVHFGGKYPCIPAEVIAELRLVLGANEVYEASTEVREGDEVVVVGGPLKGLQAVVEQVMPGCQRTAVLLEFLGRLTVVRLDRGLLMVEREGRRIAL